MTLPATASILHISDLHFGSEHATTPARQFLDFLSRTPAAGIPVPDLIVASGDFCFNAEKKSFVAAREFLVRIADLLSVPEDRLFVVPGNHDLGRCKQFFSPIRARLNFDRHLGKYARLNEWIYFHDINLSLFLFDSNSLDRRDRRLSLPLGGLSRAFAGGKVGSQALRCLRARWQELAEEVATKQVLAPASAKQESYLAGRKLDSFKVAVLHHHLIPIPVVGEDLLAVALDAGDLLKCLDECDFDLVLHGHQHHPFTAEVKYWPLWNSAPSRQASLFISGAGSLSKKESTTSRANQFSVIEFDAVDSRNTSLSFRSFIHGFEGWHEDAQGRKSAAIVKDYREGSVISPDTVKRIASQIGYKRSFNNIEITIGADGSATYIFTTRYESTITKLRQVHLRLDSESSGLKTAELAVIQADCERATITRDPDDKGFVYIYFEPHLELAKTAELRLKITCPASTYCRNREELKARRNVSKAQALEGREFFGHMVAIPTDDLQMTIRLEGTGIKPDIWVWLDEDGGEHRKATSSVQRDRKELASGASMIKVVPPMFGAKYLWTWQLPEGR